MGKYDLDTYLMKDEALLEYMDHRIRAHGFDLENVLTAQYNGSFVEFAYIVPMPEEYYSARHDTLVPPRWFVISTRNVVTYENNIPTINLAFQRRVLLVESPNKPGPYDCLQKELPKDIQIVCDYYNKYHTTCDRIIMGLLGISLYRSFGMYDPLEGPETRDLTRK